jgi:hypothetical protein
VALARLPNLSNEDQRRLSIKKGGRKQGSCESDGKIDATSAMVANEFSGLTVVVLLMFLLVFLFTSLWIWKK